MNQTKQACVKLKACALNVCEARCCYDGVYLREGEEEKIKAVVASNPDFFASLPDEFIVDGSWEGVAGRKTAVAPYNFQAPDFPVHFSKTRCVFGASDHKCLLQVLAVQRGLHKCAYKPTSCWMFPLKVQNGQLVPPPGMEESDPDCLGSHYPGYTKFVPCGQAQPEGSCWGQTLDEEIAHFHKTKPDGFGHKL